jgi:hypothetical protein
VFSEVEDNDDMANANALPNESFLYFSGSFGAGGSNYDGDYIDVFSFDCPENYIAEFYFQYNEGTLYPLKARILDADGDELGASFDGGGGYMSVQTSNPIGPDDTAPFYLEVYAEDGEDGYTDYWFGGSYYLPGGE